jgi:hypothetical protein
MCVSRSAQLSASWTSSCSGRHWPGRIRRPDCRTDRQPSVRGFDRAHGRQPLSCRSRDSRLAGWTGRLDGHQGDESPPRRFAAKVNGGDVSLNGTVTRRGAEQASPLLITRAKRIPRDPSRAQERARCRSDLAQSGRAGSPVWVLPPSRPNRYTESATANGPRHVGVDTGVQQRAPGAADLAGRHDGRRQASVQRSAHARETAWATSTWCRICT